MWIVYYFLKANVARMEEAEELRESLKKSDDYAKKLTTSVQSSFEQIKMLNKKVADLKDSLTALTKKSMHRPQPHVVEKKPTINPAWHEPEFAMKSPATSKPIMPRRQSPNNVAKLPTPPTT